MAAVDSPQVKALRLAGGKHPVRCDVADGERVKEGLGGELGARRAKARGKELGQELRAPRDLPEALGAVVDGVHGRHHREKDLGRADVGGRLVAPDMLLAGAERQPHGRVALGVLGDTHQAAGHLALEGILGGEKAGMGAAVAHGHPEPLGRAHGDVRPELAGRLQERERQEVGGDDAEGSRRVGLREESRKVMDGAVRVRVLDQDAEAARGDWVGAVVPGDDLDPQRLRPGPHDVEGLGVAGVGDEEGGA